MTKEEAINSLKILKREIYNFTLHCYNKEIDMAIEALEAQPEWIPCRWMPYM